jgi:hypothetical protein
VDVLKDRLRLSETDLAAYCQRWQIVEMSLFGSVLRDDFGSESDIDVLVDFPAETMIGLRERIAMEEELVNILGREVDLVDQRAVERSPNYIRRKSILGSALVVYAA